MDLETLLQLLGCKTPAEAAAAITRFNAFLAQAKTAANAEDPEAVISAFQAKATFWSQVLEATGAKDPASALGAIEGWKASAARVAAVEAECDQFRAVIIQTEARSLIDEAIVAGKLTPAARTTADEFFAKHGLDGLRSFLEVLVPAASAPAATSPTQPEVSPAASAPIDDAATPAERTVAKALGMTVESMRAASKLWEATKGRGAVQEASIYTNAAIKELNRSAPVAGLHQVVRG